MMAVGENAVLAQGSRPFATPAASFVSLNARQLAMVSPVAQMAVAALVVNVQKPTPNAMTTRGNVFVCRNAKRGRSVVTMVVMAPVVMVVKQGRAVTTRMYVCVPPNAKRDRRVVTMVVAVNVAPVQAVRSA